MASWIDLLARRFATWWLISSSHLRQASKSQEWIGDLPTWLGQNVEKVSVFRRVHLGSLDRLLNCQIKFYRVAFRFSYSGRNAMGIRVRLSARQRCLPEVRFFDDAISYVDITAARVGNSSCVRRTDCQCR